MKKEEYSKAQWQKIRRRLRYYCLNYDSWNEQIEEIRANLQPGSPSYDGMPHGTTVSSLVEKKAIKLFLLQDKIDMIHLAAEQADYDLAEPILRYVTSSNITFEALQREYPICCSRATFFRKVGFFYKNLDRLKTDYRNGRGFRDKWTRKKGRMRTN